MESQLTRTQGHQYESTDLSVNPSALHSGVEGHPEGEGHHEKQSVLKKVKAKAKKIKNTLTKHGHEHDHDHGHSPEEYEEDEDEEMAEDPDIHGAPTYESEAVRAATRASSGHTTGGTNFDRPFGDPRYDSTKPTAGGTNFDRPSMVGGGPHYDSTKPTTGGTNFDMPSMVADPHYDSTKPTTGGTNFDRPPMVGSDSPILDPEARPFGQWQADEEHGKHLLKEDKHPELPHKGINTRNTRTGRDVSEERKNPDAFGGRNAMEGIRGGIGTTGFQVDPQGPNIRTHPSNVQVKTIDPAGIGSEEAEGITPLIKSINKMGISEDKPNTEQAEGLYTESHDQFAPEPMPRKSSDSVPKSYNAANPQEMPGDISEPARNSSTYTEKITSASAAAASAIAGTAQSAKSAIASKIEQMRKPGEGNKTGSMTGTATAQSAKSTTASKIEQMREPGEGNKTGSMTGTASDYAHRIAATVTDTLAPVYGKVVGVGSGATSKGSGLGAETTQESGGRVGQEKGASVKEYWVEKLKPGEEDRALSSIITDSFRKPKGDKGEKMEEVPSGGGGGRGISQVVSDAVHEREPEESEKRKPLGKVTESEEVAKRLGRGEEGSGLENIGTGEGVVNKLTGAIGSWLGGQSGRAKSTPGTTLADDNEGDMKKNADAQGNTGERRLQEN